MGKDKIRIGYDNVLVRLDLMKIKDAGAKKNKRKGTRRINR